MPLQLIAEDGTGRVDANSYATVAFADGYFERHLYAGVWTGATEATKEAALIWATELLDIHFLWRAFRTHTSQALGWPRTGAYTPDGILVLQTVVPEVVQRATAEMARYLIAEDRTLENPTRGFGQLKAGPVDAVIDKADRVLVPPDSVIAMLRGYGDLVGAGVGGLSFHKLLRT